MNSLNQRLRLHIQPKWALSILGGLEIVILLLSLIGQYLQIFPDSYSIHSHFQENLIHYFIIVFDVNAEANVTTYYSVTLAIISSFLLFLIAYFKNADRDKYRFYWTVLGWFVLYIAMDDASVIHEKTSRYLKGLTDLGGWFEYKWVILGLAVVSIFAISFFRFWLHLDTKYKILFLVSAGLFFGGAVGTELIGGRWAYSFGSKNFTYVLLTTFEQGLQYGGLTMLIYSLLSYMKFYCPQFFISAQELAKENR